MMSRVPMGAAIPMDPDVGKPVNRTYWKHHEFTSQFEAAERIADKWAITRDQCEALGKSSQDRAAAAIAAGRFESQIVPTATRTTDGATHVVARDECPRETSLEGLAGLKPVARPDGVHTAGTSSQISDGAGAVLLMDAERAEQLGMRAIARVVDTSLVGTDPALMLTGPIPATRQLLERNGLRIDDIDVFEVNEAFASVILAWQHEVGADPARVNPNGGAIALGHPLGGTGAILITKAAHELARTGGRYALVAMCCGGGVATGTLLERL
jgi:acetyl-CoA C-acetyltransferase